MLTRSKTKENKAQTSATSKSTKQLRSRHPACDSCRRSKKKCTHSDGASLAISNHISPNGIIKDTRRKGPGHGLFQRTAEYYKKKEGSKSLVPDPFPSYLQGLGEGFHSNDERAPKPYSEIYSHSKLPVSNDRQRSQPSSPPVHPVPNPHGSLKRPNEAAKSRLESANHNPTSEDLQEIFKGMKSAIDSLRECTKNVQGKLKQWNETWKRHEENLENE